MPRIVDRYLLSKTEDPLPYVQDAGERRCVRVVKN